MNTTITPTDRGFMYKNRRQEIFKWLLNDLFFSKFAQNILFGIFLRLSVVWVYFVLNMNKIQFKYFFRLTIKKKYSDKYITIYNSYSFKSSFQCLTFLEI